MPDEFNVDELLGQAVQGRQKIDARKKELIAQLPSANHRQGIAIKAELQGLDKQGQFGEWSTNKQIQSERGKVMEAYRQAQMSEHIAEWSANQQRMEAHSNALETDKAIRRDRDTRIDQQGADAMIRMNGMDNALR